MTTRKPIQMELKGGKSQRQVVWELIRQNAKSFTQDMLMLKSMVPDTVVRDYMRCLVNGAYVKVIKEEKRGVIVKRTYKLVKDVGIEAPRVTRAGQEVTAGGVNEAMWGTLRRMFKATAVDYRQLAAFASTKTMKVSEATAKSYLLTLAQAGYLQCVQPATKGRRPIPGRYRLLPSMDSGRRAPMIQRTKSVFDPNWNKTVWTEKAEVADE